MTRLADQVEVTGLTIRMLEPEPALAKVNLAGNPRVHHPLQRAIHRRTTDPMVVAPDQIDQIVGAQVPFLPQEDVDDLFALVGTLAPKRLEPGEIWQGRRHAELEMGGQK